MSHLDDAIAFRSSSKPIISSWSIDELTLLGSLVWLGDRPVLTLFFDLENDDTKATPDNDIPILLKTNPPTQLTFTAAVPKFGFVTLQRCARYNVRKTYNHRAGRVIYELDFMPTAVWIGAPLETVADRITSVVASDTRLGGFFGSPNLKSYRKFDPKDGFAFDALGNPKVIWALHGPDQHQVELGDTGWLLSVHTDTIESVSASTGHALTSTVSLTIHSPEQCNIEQASKYLSSIEQILSTFSIESFIFQVETYYTDGIDKVNLIWRLGEDRSLFRPPMKHQVLIDFSDPATLEAVCKQWFLASPTVSLSRWLYVRALKETDNGLARFLAAAQAFEVLGREYGPDKKMPRDKIREAVQLIQDALRGKFEEGFIERVVKLIQSSNRASYPDILYHMLSGVVDRLRLGSDEDVRKFAKVVADTRNAVVHMTDDDKGKLDSAFAKVNKLSLQVCFWYAIFQAEQMGIAMPDIHTFLFNNRNARHGLPNEVLERA